MADSCTCALGADECDNGFGVFLPLQDGGSCVVRPCQKVVPEQQPERRRASWDADVSGVQEVGPWEVEGERSYSHRLQYKLVRRNPAAKGWGQWGRETLTTDTHRKRLFLSREKAQAHADKLNAAAGVGVDAEAQRPDETYLAYLARCEREGRNTKPSAKDPDLCREPGCSNPTKTPVSAWCREHERAGGFPHA